VSILKVGNIVTKSNVSPSVIVTVPISTDRELPNGTKTTWHAGGPLTTHTASATITYTNKPRGQRARLANLCRHLTTTLDYGADATKTVLTYDTGPGHPPHEYEYSAVHIWSGDAHSVAVSTAKAAFGGSLRGQYLELNGLGHINAAFVAIKPNLTTMSLPNMLYEIKQIRGLFVLWKKSLSVAKNLAGAFLNYKFGWKPTLGDLANLVNAVTALKQKLALFQQACGSVIHFQQLMLRETISKSGNFSYLGANHSCVWKGTITRSCVAHFAFRIMPLKAMSDLQMSLRAILDALGVELNPVIVWDAVPFTFVIDWFFDVGSFLERFSVDTLELPVVLVDSYLQYKEEVSIESSWTDNATPSVGRSPTHSGGWITREKYFQRMPLQPDFATFQGLGFRMPSFGQAILGIALGTVLAKSKR